MGILDKVRKGDPTVGIRLVEKDLYEFWINEVVHIDGRRAQVIQTHFVVAGPSANPPRQSVGLRWLDTNEVEYRWWPWPDRFSYPVEVKDVQA